MTTPNTEKELTMPSPAIEVVTDGPATPYVDIHRRGGGVNREGKPAGQTDQTPACGATLETAPAWRSYGVGRAMELGATLCTAKACFADEFGGAA